MPAIAPAERLLSVGFGASRFGVVTGDLVEGVGDKCIIAKLDGSAVMVLPSQTVITNVPFSTKA